MRKIFLILAALWIVSAVMAQNPTMTPTKSSYPAGENVVVNIGNIESGDSRTVYYLDSKYKK
jgi:hypothetical protein